MLDIQILLGVVMFTVIVIAPMGRDSGGTLCCASGDVTIMINDDPDKAITSPQVNFEHLADNGIYPSSAGGGGSCAQCRCV